jgi:hypothetical protein
MRRKYTWVVIGCCLALDAHYLSMHVAMEHSQTLIAATATDVPISGSCDDPVVAAFVPDLDYTITFSVPAAATSSPTCSGSLVLTGPVNSDSAPSVTCSLQSGGTLLLRSRHPTSKLGGLQCVVETKTKLEVHGDGSDNTNYNVAIDTVSATTWSAAKQVDNATSGAKDVIFGTGGQVASTDIDDGADFDQLTNGEVAFGGTTASEGASRLFTQVDFTNYDVQAGTDKETLTYTFTAE